MKYLSEEEVKEIVEQNDEGFRGFYHRATGELFFIPDTSENPGMDTEYFEEDIRRVEKHYADYIAFEPMEFSESFRLKADFAQGLTKDNPLKERLIAALRKQKPFMEFKSVIDYSPVYRQRWFDYQSEKLEERVKNIFEASTSGSR